MCSELTIKHQNDYSKNFVLFECVGWLFESYLALYGVI